MVSTADWGPFDAFMDGVEDFIYFKDLEHRFVRVNAAAARHAGVEPGAMIARTAADFWPPDEVAEAHRDEAAVVATGEAVRSRVHTSRALQPRPSG